MMQLTRDVSRCSRRPLCDYYKNQSIKMDFFSWRHMSRKSESEAPMAWRLDGVEEVSFESSFEGVQGARIAAGSIYIVPGSRCRD